MDYDRIPEVFVSLARQAGNVIMKYYRELDFESRRKADGTIVTKADLAADEIIRRGLAEAFPDTHVVSEENDESHKVSSREFFIVDPLDGTSGFSRGGPEFTVNIAIVRDGTPVIGVVYAPAMGRLFFNTMDGGLYEESVRPEFDEVVRIQLAREGVDNSGLRALTSRSRSLRHEVDKVLSGFSIAKVDRMSSSIKFCIIAAGEADLYPRVGATMEWDTAAGQAVLCASDGGVVELGSLRPLRYGKKGYANPAFLAFGPDTLIESGQA